MQQKKQRRTKMQYLSVSEAAKRMGKSRQWVWVLVRMNRLKAIRIGNQFCVSEDDVKNFNRTAERN